MSEQAKEKQYETYVPAEKLTEEAAAEEAAAEAARVIESKLRVLKSKLNTIKELQQDKK